MDAQKLDSMMGYIMNKFEEEQLSLGDAISVWHSMGTFIFSQTNPENQDFSKIYADMHEYLNEVEKMNQGEVK